MQRGGPNISRAITALASLAAGTIPALRLSVATPSTQLESARGTTATRAGRRAAKAKTAPLKWRTKRSQELTLDPGVEVRFGSSVSLTVGGTTSNAPGALIADASLGTMIKFTADSMTPTPGFWRSIVFRAGADGTSVLNNVIVEYGGQAALASAFFVLLVLQNRAFARS